MAWRDREQIFKERRPTVDQAIAEGVASWAIDHDDLLDFRRKGIRVVGVLLYNGVKTVKRDRRNATLFLAPLERWFDKLKAPRHSFEEAGGADQHYMRLQHFAYSQGTVYLRR